jgi:hypothetical protein
MACPSIPRAILFCSTILAAVEQKRWRNLWEQGLIGRFAAPLVYWRAEGGGENEVAYQTWEHAVRKGDALRNVSAYLDVGFVRGLREPYVRRGR